MTLNNPLSIEPEVSPKHHSVLVPYPTKILDYFSWKMLYVLAYEVSKHKFHYLPQFDISWRIITYSSNAFGDQWLSYNFHALSYPVEGSPTYIEYCFSHSIPISSVWVIGPHHHTISNCPSHFCVFSLLPSRQVHHRVIVDPGGWDLFIYQVRNTANRCFLAYLPLIFLVQA